MVTVERETTDTFENFLIEQNLVSFQDIEKIKQIGDDTGESLCSALRRTSILESASLVRAISAYYGIPAVDEREWPSEPLFSGKISLAFMRESKVFPIADTDDGVILAMADPSDSYTLEAIRLATHRPIIPMVAAAEDIDAAIERISQAQDKTDVWMDVSGGDETSEDVQQLRDIALGTPIVRFVNQLITDSIHARATDIHIEPFDGRLVIRIRVDGMLREVSSPPPHMAKAIVSRIKILSGLNIAERRLPQDGRARVRIDYHRLDLRIATMPTIHGESVAIRLLDNVRRSLDFSKLGFAKRDETVIQKHLSAPFGLIVVTGPTGSGKTTTLATALSLLNQSHRKILTIEDPIEYEIEGVNQTQTRPNIGLNFATALRSFLRHDPDVIMVGEMRDGETASIGIHAALTGHLVLTTLHTNTAAGAIPRLLDMGIDAFLLASSLRCVIGQRLVRILCNHCKEPYFGTPDVQLTQANGSAQWDQETTELWRAVGCDRCFGTGYNDRIALSEVLDVNEEIRRLIKPGTPTAEIQEAACRLGMTTMVGDGLRKCQDGLTTAEEVRRVALDI